MRYLIGILSIFMMTLSCKNKTREKTTYLAFQGTDLNVKKQPTIATASTSANVRIEQIYKSNDVTIDLKNDNFNFTLFLEIGNLRKEYNLSELNIPTLTPEFFWANEDYVCMVTWWSQAQVRHVFIPIKRTNQFIYLNKNIEEMDRFNNNIVYIDSIHNNRDTVVFRVENLLTRKSKALEFTINEQNQEFPFYEDIIVCKNKLTIKSANQTKTIDFTGISSDKF